MGKKKRRNSNSVLKRLSIRGLKIIVFIIVPILLFSYFLRIKEITVTGSTRYTEEEIRQELVQTRTDNNALFLYLKYNYFKEVRIPFVEKIDLELKSLDAVAIRVYEKMVTGCVEFMGEFLYFDKDGIVVESSPEQLEDIPLIKGLLFNRIVLNEKLEVQKEELFDTILNLTQLINKYELDIKTIQFGKSYEVTVDCGNVTALLGKRRTYDVVLSELRDILHGSREEINQILDKSNGTKLELDMTKFSESTDSIIATPKKSPE